MKQNNPEIDRMMHLSTVHVTPKDMACLNASTGPGIVSYAYEYGSLTFVPEEANMAVILLNEGWSEGIIKALQFARRHDCKWVKFDCDGPEMKDLIDYKSEWEKAER